jgi:hypothetical protein
MDWFPVGDAGLEVPTTTAATTTPMNGLTLLLAYDTIVMNN